MRYSRSTKRVSFWPGGAELSVGRYVLLSELGAGGMGTVFKARDTAMDRVVALKLIRDERLANPAALARFQQEVRAAARLAHPNIVRAYDAGTADGRHFLVTELVTGHDLGHELARRGALPPGEACEYARQAAVGLQHAYEQGLTHRDIKPSNLLFSTAEKLVKVADFGLARVGEAGANGLTADGSVMGTPDYIAPEQASSATAADIRSDLYSLGCTLYHFLTGHVPFPADSAYAKLLAHARDEPEPLDDACPGLNPALVAVVRKLMAKNPAERYQTPREAAEALIPFCPKPRTGTTSVVARPATAPPPLPVAPPASASNPVVLPTPSTQNNSGRKTLPPPLPVIPEAFPVPEPHPAAKSNKALALAGIGGGVLALVVLIVVLLRGGNTNTNTNQNNVNVAVPVSVTVALEGWPAARQPGVRVFVGDRALTAAELARPLELPPGRHTLVVKKDGKELESRYVEVSAASAGRSVFPRPVPVLEPASAAGELRRWYTGAPVTDAAWAPDGKLCFALSNTILCFNPNASALVSQSRGVKMSRFAVLRYADRWFVLSGHDMLQRYNSGVTALDLATGNSVLAGEMHMNLEDFTYPLSLGSPDGKRRMWTSVPNGGSHAGFVIVSELVCAPHPDWLATVSGWKEVARYPGSTGCFDPNGGRVLAAQGQTLTLYSEDTNAPMKPTYTGLTSTATAVAMRGDGSQIAAVGGTTVSVWNVGTGAPAIQWKVPSAVNAIAFTNDGARVVSAGEDGTVRVWDATSGKELHQYKHDGPVYALAMSPGGKRVLTGGADKTIRLWQLPP